MIRTLHAAALGSLFFGLAAGSASAELTLCNRTSYLMDAALGLESRANVTTRGWFRLTPGQCRQVVDGALTAELVYVHARTPAVYGSAPLARGGHADLCVRQLDFETSDARNCPAAQQVSFTAARPSDSPQGPTVSLAEEAAYDDEQARLAGVQRLLVIAGYDATPIDGIDGSKTQKALAKFLTDRKLPSDTPSSATFFDTLLAAVQNPQGFGFSWCNDTKYPVMASVGIAEMGAIVTRGWYRVAAQTCVRPDLPGEPRRIYSYAEAVDANGRAIKRGEEALSWGGKTQLCTRDGKFELAEHKDCAARGLNSAGFTVIDTGDKPATTVHFKEP